MSAATADPVAPTTRNKPWTRDELLLALDLYFRINPKAPDPNSEDVIELI